MSYRYTADLNLESKKIYQNSLKLRAAFSSTLVVSDHVMDGRTSYLDSAATDSSLLTLEYFNRLTLKTDSLLTLKTDKLTLKDFNRLTLKTDKLTLRANRLTLKTDKLTLKDFNRLTLKTD